MQIQCAENCNSRKVEKTKAKPLKIRSWLQYFAGWRTSGGEIIENDQNECPNYILQISGT
jgi:hypothetical protein